MGRPKKAVKRLDTLEDVSTSMQDLLRAQLELEVLTAERDLAVAGASKQFEARLDAAKNAAAQAKAALKAYYYAHVKEIEVDGTKHLTLTAGVMGRRDNPPALKPMNKAWTWEAICTAVRTGLGLEYFRQPDPELDKEKLKVLPAEKLREYGLKVEGEETFYVEPARLADGGGE